MLDWQKCKGGVWCELFKLDLEHPAVKINGLFILWSGTSDRKVLFVGMGNVQKELSKQFNNIAIRAFQGHGLYVTWAETSSSKTKNYYSFIVKKLAPKFNSTTGLESPADVNLPW